MTNKGKKLFNTLFDNIPDMIERLIKIAFCVAAVCSVFAAFDGAYDEGLFGNSFDFLKFIIELIGYWFFSYLFSACLLMFARLCKRADRIAELLESEKSGNTSVDNEE